ncbi:MAG: hypothetical protein HUJ91_07055 [Bacteroidales bacterium]|nr:hypothetical protein [Bacteroidales bacterium]
MEGNEIIGGGWLSDCRIDTDIDAFIPDDYINVAAEKMRLYRELDNMKTPDKVESFRGEMQDRFGTIPQPLENLMNIVLLRQKAIDLGFEKIILKNGLLILYFVLDQNSSYYKSATFGSVLKYMDTSSHKIRMKQERSLHLVCENVRSAQKAVDILQEMLNLQFAEK